VELERSAFGAMDLDSNGQLAKDEYLGGYLGFERALNKVMVAADNDPRDRELSGKELRAITRDDVESGLLKFYEHVSYAPRLQDEL
jgi:hypothetical protein